SPPVVGAEITELLRRATDQQLLDSMGLLELLQARGELDLTAEGIRERLIPLAPPRTLSIRRVLTLPLENLLVPDAQWRSGRHRISRGLLRRLQDLVLENLDAACLEGARASIEGRFTHDAESVLRAGSFLWPPAGDVLQAAAASAREAKRSW